VQVQAPAASLLQSALVVAPEGYEQMPAAVGLPRGSTVALLPLVLFG